MHCAYVTPRIIRRNYVGGYWGGACSTEKIEKKYAIWCILKCILDKVWLNNICKNVVLLLPIVIKLYYYKLYHYTTQKFPKNIYTPHTKV